MCLSRESFAELTDSRWFTDLSQGSSLSLSLSLSLSPPPSLFLLQLAESIISREGSHVEDILHKTFHYWRQSGPFLFPDLSFAPTSIISLQCITLQRPLCTFIPFRVIAGVYRVLHIFARSRKLHSEIYIHICSWRTVIINDRWLTRCTGYFLRDA